ncbi:MAG TPA: dihydroxy-acid dehydratase [Patescibacteria group bacterium]|nr:dihydroxy-acid dehydratase [Patescibacteria group bacterium]
MSGAPEARFESDNPGREAQAVGTARFLGQPPENIHGPVWAVVGNQGDSQCYLGVEDKVEAIQAALAEEIVGGELDARLIDTNFVGGVSDGQLNGTPRMRYSLVGREVTNDGINMHLSASDVRATIAVVACDKPPVGTLSALLEHNEPAIIMSDGSIRPHIDSQTGERKDIVDGFQGADADQSIRNRLALEACPGYGSCGGMFTYNTMQSFISVLGMEPLEMVSPASEDERRTAEFPGKLVENLRNMVEQGIRPRDIVTPASLKNAMTVAIAMGGSTNVVLHAPEIARAAGLDFWEDVMSQNEFNELSRQVPVLVNARPFGKYSMVDIDEKGGLQVIVQELLDTGLLDGECLTCTGETLQEQVNSLAPPSPDGEVICDIDNPFKETGGLRILNGNLAPDGGAVIKIAGVETGVEDGVFEGSARVFNSEIDLLKALKETPDIFEDKDMVVIRYEGPRGAPGMPEMLDPTSRITALCRRKGITIALMTDARFSGGSVGLVIGHVGPEAYLGGPIALIEEGDKITVDINSDSIDCAELSDPEELAKRQAQWHKLADGNGGVHPDARRLQNRLLKRMRKMAASALEGGGIDSD